MLNTVLGPILRRLPENNRMERIWKLAEVDFKKRYYNDRLGLVWALLNPLMRVSVYYVVFTFFRLSMTDEIPNFALFLFSGLIIWMAFVETSKKGMRVLISKKYLIQNIRLNKLDLFISNGLASLLGFLFNLSAFLIATFLIIPIFSDIPTVTASVFFIPILVLNTFLIAIGFGMILSVIYIHVKDIFHLLDIVFLIGFWTSGIIIPVDKAILEYPIIGIINPFIGIVTNFRSVILYDRPIHLTYMIASLVWGVIFYLIGAYLVNKKSHLAFEKI